MALKEILAKFGFEVDSKPLDKADKKAESLAKRIITTFAAAEIVGAVRGFVTEMFDLEGSITDTSDALGISRQSFQEWSYIASRGGASAEDMATALKILQKNAAGGSDAFKKLGVDIKGADGQIKPVESLMGDVATALSKVENPAERTKLALELLGKGGSKLNAIFAKGPEAIAELRARFLELGGGLTEEALDAIGGAADAMDDVELASRSLKGSLMIVLAPALRTMTNTFASVIAYFNKGESAATRMKAAVVILGVAGAAAGVAMLAPYLPFIVALAAAYLIVQDFLTFLEGGESVSGSVIKWLFGDKVGPEEVKAWIEDVKKKFEEFRDTVEKKPGGGGVLDYVEEAFSRIGGAIVEEFVTIFENDIPQAVQTAAEEIRASGGSLGGWIILLADAALGVTSFVDTVKRIATIGPMIIDILKSLASKIIETATQIGDNIVAGILKGFSVGLPKLEEGALGVGAAAIKGINKGAGNKSPSVKGRAAANNIVDGVLLQLAQRLPDVDSMAGRVGARAIPVTNHTRNVSIQQQNSMHFNVAASQAGMVPAMRSGMAAGLSDERGALQDALMST